MSKIYGYCRVSTKGQLEGNSLEQQKEEILNRYENAEIIKESFTGTTTNRPVFNELISKLNKDDILVITKLDRFCRSAKEGLELVEELRERGVIIHILNMGLIEDTAMGKLILTNLLAFAEFERNMIIERTSTGKEIAKQRPDFKEGRPKKYTIKQLNNALSMLSVNGGSSSYTEVEEVTGISKSTLIREQRKHKVK